MTKSTISVALAVLNEEANLARCLDAVHPWVDEIVIFDEGSTDATPDIAKKYSRVKFFKTEHQPIFHITKQKAIAKCTGDWILQLDADEVVTPELHREIISTISSNPSDNGFWINRSNYFLGRFLQKGGVYPDPTIRLYRRGQGRLPARDVHEQAEIDGTVGHLKSDLLHYSDPTFSRYLIRNDRYTSLLAADLKKQHLKINFLSFLNYFIVKPIHWFVLAYFLHRGYADGFPGFVFAMFSSLRFPIAYIKLYENQNTKEK